jgi:S1-C subfamily serine protease
VVLDGTVFRSHRQLDFALLWLMEGGPFPTLGFGDPRALRHAQTILAVGCPSGLSNTVSSGIVSNPAQRVRGIELIQTNADIDKGNSGGPMIAEDGVVGIAVCGLGTIGAGKFGVPIDYFSADIARAARLGREACLAATFCRRCGSCDPEDPLWYCRNCGAPHERAPDEEDPWET